MIVVDTSALVAMTFGEPSAPALSQRLLVEGQRMVSAASLVEFGAVAAGRRRGSPEQTVADVDAVLRTLLMEVVPVDEAQARIALEARIRFGRGFGAKAGLNFGDSFAYALAKVSDAPLLFVGDDFRHTDIVAAL